LAKGGIIVVNPPKCSVVLARWQHRTDSLAAVWEIMHVLAERFALKSFLPLCVIGSLQV